jgi:DNA-binding GntR family transcriptional regulator
MTDFDIDEIKEYQNRSLVEVIFRQMEGMILSGNIQPGERINESKISNLLGVSRAPIREALRLLASNGILEIRANRGMFVRDIKVQEVDELYDIRAALDALAGERAAALIHEEQLPVLQKWIGEMALHAEANDVEAYYRANINFHTAIVEIAGNENLLSIYEGIRKRMSLFRKASLSLPGQLSVSLRKHEKILAAIASQDPAKAGNMLRSHTLEAKKTLLRAIRDKKASS